MSHCLRGTRLPPPTRRFLNSVDAVTTAILNSGANITGESRRGVHGGFQSRHEGKGAKLGRDRQGNAQPACWFRRGSCGSAPHPDGWLSASLE